MRTSASTSRVPLLLWPLVLVASVLSVAAPAFSATAGTDAFGSGVDTRAAVDTRAVDHFLEAQISRHGIPGLSVAIIEDGQVRYARGYGRAGPGRPMTANTPQPIASMTKPFTAVAVLQLVDEGLVELDAPVQTYLPEFEVADPKVSAEITVRDLLQHTSGLSDLGYRRLLDPVTSLEQGVRDLRHAEPTARPGEAFQYFNPNYAILALLVQKVTGRPYAEVVADRILTPLGMSDSTADPDSSQHQAQGYVKLFGMAIPLHAPVRRYRDGAGNLVSTAADLARFAIAVGLPSGASAGLLSEASLHAMQNPPGGLGYGLGWQVTEENGERVSGHDGLRPTYSGQMAVLPEWNRGYVVLMNQGHLAESMLVFPQIGAGMVDLLSGRDAHVEGLSARTMGWALLAGFILIAFFSVRSLLRLRTWQRRRIALSRRRQAWAIGSHFLTAGLLLGLMYRAVPMLLGRAYNLSEVGLYYLPEVTLMVAVSVVTDLVAGTVMLALAVTGHPTAPVETPVGVRDAGSRTQTSG